MDVTITFDRLRWEEKALKEAADNAGLKSFLVDVKGLIFEVPKKPAEFGDVVLQRCISHYRSSLLTQMLEGAGLRVINSCEVAVAKAPKGLPDPAASQRGSGGAQAKGEPKSEPKSEDEA